MLKQKREISSNFVPDVKQIIWRWLVGMHESGAVLSKSSMYVSGRLLYKVCINLNRWTGFTHAV